MLATLYLETNFILSFATGRSHGSNSLLTEPIGSIRLAIPSVCVMEAYSVFENERKLHNKFVDSLKDQIRIARRNVVYPDYPSSLIKNLEAVIIDVQRTFDLYQGLLFNSIGALCGTGEIIEPPPDVIREGRYKILIEDPTDNLILGCILHHARANPSLLKAFLIENRKDFEGNQVAKEALELAGVKCFSDASHCMGWLRAQLST